jgi:DNA-binding NarL/FixJ family response regulator
MWLRIAVTPSAASKRSENCRRTWLFLVPQCRSDATGNPCHRQVGFFSTKLVFFTGSLEQYELLTSAAPGAHGVILKDVAPEILLESLRQIARSHLLPRRCSGHAQTSTAAEQLSADIASPQPFEKGEAAAAKPAPNPSPSSESRAPGEKPLTSRTTAEHFKSSKS